MKTALQTTASIALLAIAAFFCLLGVEIDHARLIVETNVAAVRHEIDLTIQGDPNAGNSLAMMPLRDLLVAEVDLQVSNARADVKEVVGDLRKDTFSELGRIRTDAGGQLTSIQTNALTAIATAAAPLNTAAGTVEQFRKDLQPTLHNAGVMTQHVADALPPFTDCAYLDENGEPVGGNPDCAFNRFQGVSKAIEKMARAGADAAPKLTASATSVGDSVAGVAAAAKREADELTRPKTKAQQAQEWLKLLPRVLVALLGL